MDSSGRHLLAWFMAVSGALAGCGKSEPAQPTSASAPAPETTAPATTAPPTTPATTAPPTTPATTAPATTGDADATAAPSTTGCVAQDLFQPLSRISPDHASLVGDSVTLCGETDDTIGWCFGIELGSGAVSGAKQRQDDSAHLPNYASALNDPFRRQDDKPVLQLCLDAKTGCKDVYVGNATAATLADDRQRFVVTTLDERERRVRVYDAATFGEIGNILIEKDADLPDCTFGAAVGDALVVATGACPAGSPHKAWLANATTGEKLGDIGGVADFDLRFGGYVHVKDDLWAFRDASGKRIVVQDVKTGAVQATADTSGLGAVASGATWLFASADPLRIVALENRPQTGSIYIIDPMTGALSKRIVPTACP